MSHFTTVQTQMSDWQVLEAVLKQNGYTQINNNVNVKDYYGNEVQVDWAVKVTEKHWVGFKQRADGYEVIADFYNFPDAAKAFFSEQLLPEYSCAVIEQKLKYKSNALVSPRKKLADGTIQITVQYNS